MTAGERGPTGSAIAVLDASAGIEIALSRGNAPLYEEKLGSASKVITSELYKAEAANILWEYHEYVDISSNNEEALVEGIRIGNSVYDLLYFTLARRNGALLLTRDKRLTEAASKNGIEVL